MGHVESRFKQSVELGDHKKAYELYYNKKTLRDSVDPTEKCYADGSTLLHQTARHAMQPLYEVFLESSYANPLDRTNDGKSCIHLICSEPDDADIRGKMLLVTLRQYHQAKDAVSQADKSGNTPLHYACSSGLQDCISLLLEAGANPAVTNTSSMSPVDLAAANNYSDIAKQLETHIVFAGNTEKSIVVEMDPVRTEETVVGVALKNQEIQSMKDVLIIETSELLGVSLFTAEALLRNNEWSKEALLNSWMTDPRSTCEKAGVDLPMILSLDNIDDQIQHQPREAPPTSSASATAHSISGRNQQLYPATTTATTSKECSICFSEAVAVGIQIPCEHAFCTDCWQHYLHDKIANGKVGEISCPEYGCYKLVPIHIVEKLVSRDMARKYLQYDIKSFVDTNPNIRWCPFPGCDQAVKKPQLELEEESSDKPPTCLFVHCGNDHYFCWLCGEIGHAPSSCKEWKDWLNKVKELSARLSNMTSSQVADAASSQWVLANSKACPNCGAPIEKTSGCNHMKCWKCKHDFCWMCLDRWNKHSSATGGYFECNRYQLIEKAKEAMDSKLQDEDLGQISRFRHYYDRYSNHTHSLELESKYLYSADTKMSELQQLAAGSVSSEDVQFVKDAVRQLVEARHTLIASYGYGYFVYVQRVRQKFERLQGDFEEHVEALAEVVAKPHLRKSKYDIIQLTSCVKEKRQTFISEVEEGLHRPPTPTLESLMNRTIQNEQYNDGLRERMREREQRREEERQIRQAIQESTRQYQTEAQLNSDTELAILLSMQEPPTGHQRQTPAWQQRQMSRQQQPKSRQQQPTSRRQQPVSRQQDHSGGELLIFPGSLSNGSPAATATTGYDYPAMVVPEQEMFVHQSASQNSRNSDTNFDLDKWRQALIEGPNNLSSSSSSSPSPRPSPGHAPSHSIDSSNLMCQLEEEELQTAIALSLSVAPTGSNNSSSDYNNLDAEENPVSSNTVLNLLHSTKRRAADV